MRSRAEIRALIENVLRAVSVALLAFMLWSSLDRDREDTVVTARSATLGEALRKWSAAGVAPDRIAASLDIAPDPASRDWLAALGGAGSEVTWSGDIPAVALDVQPVRSPRGGFTVVTAAPAGSAVSIADDIGALDTATAARGGAVFSVPSASGTMSAAVKGSRAVAAVPEPAKVRRILVLGNAGWEAKFVVAALEEDGWKVDASMHVAPGVSVTQGSISPIDTSRYSAVIALDGSAASRASDISRYVAAGGGLVIAGAAAAIEGFSQVRAGAPGRTEAPQALSSDAGSTTLRSLPVIPVAGLRSDAVPLDRRGAVVAVAARRQLTGRVLQAGYLDSWRWRMGGGDESVAAHRSWWTHAVASVAFVSNPASMAVSPTPSTMSAAPLADLIAALGPASAAPESSLASATGAISLWLLFTLLALSLLGEWASRRLRGIR